jgi:hypothetical protein
MIASDRRFRDTPHVEAQQPKEEDLSPLTDGSSALVVAGQPEVTAPMAPAGRYIDEAGRHEQA